ncbi:hypothetical protein [Rhodococcoides fascians]|uniref:hypothetical protein n=1 Tax=Rhodococcoides fascians TaxID=1828 RepID=UPI00050C9787|nr:hypothetical protein [Rhodococcus fascians]
MSHNARTVVIARTIAEGKKFIAETPDVPINALVIVDDNAMRGVTIEALFWAPGWDLRRSPEKRRLIETSAHCRLRPQSVAGTIHSGLINLTPELVPT